MRIEYSKGPELSFEAEYDPVPLSVINLQNVLAEIDRLRNCGEWEHITGNERAAWFELMYISVKILHENGYFDKKEVSE